MRQAEASTSLHLCPPTPITSANQAHPTPTPTLHAPLLRAACRWLCAPDMSGTLTFSHFQFLSSLAFSMFLTPIHETGLRQGGLARRRANPNYAWAGETPCDIALANWNLTKQTCGRSGALPPHTPTPTASVLAYPAHTLPMRSRAACALNASLHAGRLGSGKSLLCFTGRCRFRCRFPHEGAGLA